MKQYKSCGFFLWAVGVCLVTIVNADTLFDNRFQDWKQKADNGNARAQYKVGKFYLHGNGVNVSVKQAISWFQKSALNGNAKAGYRLGKIYYGGLSGSKNYHQAFKWWLKAANKSHPQSQYYIALLYKDGLGVSQNSGRALLWANKAQNNGVTKASVLISSIRSGLTLPGPKKSRSVHKDVAPIRKAKRNTHKRTAAITIPTTRKIAKRKVATRKLVMGSQWSSTDNLIERTALELSQCVKGLKTVRCKSKRLKTQTKDYMADFRVETMLTEFDSYGNFILKYRVNYIFVMPTDADDPNPQYYIPSMGPDKTVIMNCALVGRQKIKCVTGNNKIVRYTKFR